MGGDDAPATETPAPRLGSYRLVKPLGSGGMSSVFRAQHVETGVEVALKILPRTLARNKTLLQRFLREAKSAEALEHPNIVAIYDHGVDNGQYYLVLEFVSGGDLHDWVRNTGPMSAIEAVGVIKAVAEGLSFAATQGLIHRDVKPANLLRTPEGIIKIADLGLALQAEAEDERVTREGTTVGTVDYMSPEQARDSRGTSERSDIYSLGCTLYFLLTGQPPFPGGDVTSKLSRHFTAPPPDPAEFRPDLPAELSQLVRKMMAKRPENRYANYKELLNALNALPLNAPPPPGPTETLDAVFDDDDEPPAPVLTELRGADPEVLNAVFDDEDDGPTSDGFLPLDLSEGEAVAPVPQDHRLADVSMADLASMDDDDAAPVARRADRDDRAPVRRSGLHPGGSSAAARPVLEPEDDEELAVEGTMPAQVAFGTGRVMSQEERRWLKGLVLGGVGLIVAVIAFHQLYRSTIIVPSSEVASGETREPEAPEPVAPADPAPTPKVETKAASAIIPAKTIPAKLAAVVPKTVRPGVVTPGPAPAPAAVVRRPEPAFSAEVESKFRPDWAAAEIPSEVAGKIQNVRRLSDTRDPSQKSRLSGALEVIGNGTIEVADNGPFFEDDLRVAGDIRMIRAREGFRPIVCLDTPRLAVVAQQSAFVELDARSLILDGLDLIVDVKELPRNFASIFLLRGGSLTLRNCTVTVVNRGGLPISLVQTVESAKPSRVRFERSLVRGAFTSAVDIATGGADVVLSRSAIVNAHGAAFTSVIAGTGERRIFLSRSLCATRGPAVEIAASSAGGRSHPLGVRALATSFVHLAATSPTSVVAEIGDESVPAEMVAWQGEANTFAGWSDWLSTGTSHKVVIADLSGLRGTWAGSDAQSVETSAARSVAVAPDHIGSEGLRDLAGDRPELLARIAVPSPMIHERTVEAFPHPVVPGLTAANGTLLASQLPTPALRSGFRELTFDTEAGQLSGDLGRFLAANLSPKDTVVRIVVSGTSPHVWTPVKVPDRVSLMIDVVPDQLNRAPSWSLTKGAVGDAFISTHEGSLSLSGVKFLQAGSSAPRRLIVVDGGHLVIQRSRLIVRGAPNAGAGGLVEFRALGTSPLKPPSSVNPAWPFETPTDRATCRVTDSVLITGDVALDAEVGRGLVAVAQCAIAAGSSAFVLRPASVPRESLAADLWLDRCTVASEHAFVTLGAWRGDAAGPNRPWLVSTHRSAFFAAFDHRAADSVLLRADSDGLTRGALFWQASGDAFEVPLFAAIGDATAPANHRADVVRQWADLWGRAHFHSVTGPRPPGSTMTRRLNTRVLKPGEVQPGDLAIDLTFPQGDPPRELGVDLARLKINPSPRTPAKR